VISQIEVPAAIDMAPGETRAVTIRVACNQAWLLNVQTDNPQIRMTGRYFGTPGGTGATGHVFEITLTCAPGSKGPQHTTLAARLVPNTPIAALLP
jgi:hypothetical protein